MAGHAGGNFDTRKATGSLETYGDSSAVMGYVEGGDTFLNSFTAPRCAASETLTLTLTLTIILT